MSLIIHGQSGGQTVLSADDDKFGVMTQVPENAVSHSQGGLTASNGSTGFGTPFTLATYHTTTNPTAGDTTLTTTLASADAPYKMRILGAKVTMLNEANGMLRKAANSCSVQVLGLTDSIAALDVSDMKQSEQKAMVLSRTGGEVITASSGSLSVVSKVRLGETGTTDTLSMLIELTCLRVI